MSISISIGSDPKDIRRIQSTVNILNELKTFLLTDELDPNSEMLNPSSAKYLEELSQWYQNILHILYTGGSPQELTTDFF